MASHLVMGQELHAAIAEMTLDAPYASQRALYEKYFRNADWDKFDQRLRELDREGVVVRRPHPGSPSDRLVSLSPVGRETYARPRAIERGRKRRGEE